MRRASSGVMAFVWMAGSTLALGAERWVHVRVIDHGEDGERVRINIPLSLAEKVLPTIKADKLRNGKIKIQDHDFEQVDVRALLEAVRTTQDNEFVTVDSKHENVRVAKAGSFLLVKVRESEQEGKKGVQSSEGKSGSNVDIKIPFTVVDALLSGSKDELDLVAALRALDNAQDVELVTVNDQTNNVRIWVDSRSTAD
jgi:hypothetical protein